MQNAALSNPEPAAQWPKIDRRRHQRVSVNLLGRFMLENKREYPCQVIDMSPGGAAIIAPTQGRIGERVVAYVDHIGRVEGRVVRALDGGFAMTIDATLRKRDKLAAQLTWLANRHVLNLPEDRRHERFPPKNPFSTVVMPDGRELRCRIIDVSLSGAGIAISEKAPVGSSVTVGRMRARVVRHFDDGIAVEFANLQTPETLEAHLAGNG
jgi:hypothetical protein